MMRPWLQCAIAALLLPVAYTLPMLGAVDDRPTAKESKKIKVRGKIVRTTDPGKVVLRTDDNREVVFYTNRETRYLVNERAGRFADLRVGVAVNAEYFEEGDRYIANSFVVGAAALPAEPREEGELVEGSVVRVVGDNQVIVRTKAGKEVILYVSPQTRYTFDDEAGRFTDLRPGVEIRINYDVREKRNMARTILGKRRGK